MPNSPFIWEPFFPLWPTSTKFTVNVFFQKYAKTRMATTFKHRFFFFFPFFLFFAVLGITLRFSGWMFQPTGAISYTCQPCIFFLYCIHLRNTPLHILVLVPSSQFVSNSAFYFFCSYWGKSWMVTVNRFVMQSDPPVCVCVFWNHKNNMNSNRRD